MHVSELAIRKAEEELPRLEKTLAMAATRIVPGEPAVTRPSGVTPPSKPPPARNHRVVAPARG